MLELNETFEPLYREFRFLLAEIAVERQFVELKSSSLLRQIALCNDDEFVLKCLKESLDFFLIEFIPAQNDPIILQYIDINMVILNNRVSAGIALSEEIREIANISTSFAFIGNMVSFVFQPADICTLFESEFKKEWRKFYSPEEFIDIIVDYVINNPERIIADEQTGVECIVFHNSDFGKRTIPIAQLIVRYCYVDWDMPVGKFIINRMNRYIVQYTDNQTLLNIFSQVNLYSNAIRSIMYSKVLRKYDDISYEYKQHCLEQLNEYWSTEREKIS